MLFYIYDVGCRDINKISNAGGISRTTINNILN